MKEEVEKEDEGAGKVDMVCFLSAGGRIRILPRSLCGLPERLKALLAGGYGFLCMVLCMVVNLASLYTKTSRCSLWFVFKEN